MLIPLDAKKWDFTTAAHLLNRAGFGGTPEQIEMLHELGMDGAVNQFVDAADDSAMFPKPDWAVPHNFVEMRRAARNLPEEERKKKFKELQKDYRQEGMSLISWWLDRMERTPNPFREKMTFFWHGHFATSIQKVKQPYLMWVQNETLRQNALQNFGTMAKAISRDPAMMIWLDTRESKKQHPNENFARELMELFTLGIGNYTEEDIQQAARAFTGYKIDQRDQTFRFAELLHDNGPKTFFGQTGNFSGDDIIDRILQKPACSEYLANKIWEFFAYDDPTPALVSQLAARFRAHKYEIKPLMREILRSAEFYSPQAIRSQVKSPVQWMVGTSKILGTELPTGPVAINALRQLGQVPFAPPSVKGWDGGKAWITTSTLLFRYNLANFAVGNGPLNVQRMGKPGADNKMNRPGFEVQNRAHIDLAKIAPPELRNDPKALVTHLAVRLFNSPLSPNETQSFVTHLEERNGSIYDRTIRDLLHLMMSTPQFQLT